MNNHELATRIARGIFEVGDERTTDLVQRIAFKGGTWPDGETDLGGLNEMALAGVVFRLLEQFSGNGTEE